jgi:hypothetical protein
VLPFIAANGATFQQDNARPHIARANMDFLHQNSIDVLPLPALSPELSITLDVINVQVYKVNIW